jgi:flagellar biosynthesis/type III secretory pathway M-ring protein FliF/YscJ
MNLFVGFIILLTVTLVVAMLALLFMPGKKPKTQKKIEVPKIEKRKKAARPKFKETPSGEIIIPKEIPRTIDTIKVMTQESPDLVVGIIKNWLREKR